MDATKNHEIIERTTFHEQMDRNAPTKNQNTTNVQALEEMLEGQMDRNAPTKNQNYIDVQPLVQMPEGQMHRNAPT